MKTHLFNKLFLLLFMVSLLSCQAKYAVLEYYPLQEFEFSSDSQVFSYDVEDIVHTVIVNYWEGGKEVREQQPFVENGRVGPCIDDDLYFDGGWFIVQSTHEPLKLVVKMDKNESVNPRHIELWVKMVGRLSSGKIDKTKGPGYRIDLHQAGYLEGE